MRLLWITNILFPDICKELSTPSPVTGGWMKSAADAILELTSEIDLAVGALYKGIDKLYIKKIGKITYYCLPYNENSYKYNTSMEKDWLKVKEDFKPEIVHIHGTEFAHGLAYIKACGNSNVVISIQGLITGIARYSLGEIPENEIKKYRTFYDFYKGHILQSISKMTQRGKIEKEYIERSKFIIGRTDWDFAHAKAINPLIQYFFCNETLSPSFYKYQWDFNLCQPYSIFVSQGHKPIKGLHKIISALPIVIREYPNTKLYISGNNFIKNKTIKEKLRLDTYANYIQHRIKALNLEKHIFFTGLLKEEEMVQQYLKSHIFVCPSIIENSPNSLGEAQILGVPCIASYVGGIPNMIEHKISGLLYQSNEHEVLAQYICQLFNDKHFCNFISKNEIRVALKRHDKIANAQMTLNIYNKIIK